MVFVNMLFLAFKAIARNRLRSLLTALGVVIGVASVIAMVQLGQAATASVTGQISSLGSGLLYVLPGTARRGPGSTASTASMFDTGDVAAVERTVDQVHVAPVTQGKALIVLGNANYPTSITGTTNAFFEARDWRVEQGRVFEERELARGSSVCIVGSTIVEELFGDAPPIGTSLRIGKTRCDVVGVLESKGKTFGTDQDDIVLMPIKAVQRRIAGNTDINMFFVSVFGSKQTQDAKVQIETILRERRRIADGQDDDFNVMDMEDVADTLSSTTAILTSLLGAIAAVSLIVGGVGIMNIMMVSVTERTREIGIRLAIGARGREVLLQFMVEAVAVSSLGGLLGVVVGVAGTWVAVRQLGLDFVLSPDVIALSFLFSVIIGVVFGFLPARKAARLDPIQALRHE